MLSVTVIVAVLTVSATVSTLNVEPLLTTSAPVAVTVQPSAKAIANLTYSSLGIDVISISSPEKYNVLIFSFADTFEMKESTGITSRSSSIPQPSLTQYLTLRPSAVSVAGVTVCHSPARCPR